MSAVDPLAAFQVSWLVHLVSGFVERYPRLWKSLGNLETHTFREQLDNIPVEKPVYVAGLARAGTTILLELLARHPDVATHQYRDFPGQFVPIWWNSGRISSTTTPRERAHGDGLAVTEQSPEAMEEMLWMAFFDHLHDPGKVNVLDAERCHPEFESFYRDHIRKLLLTRKKPRYVAKGNYNFTRFSYLKKNFPDCRFVVVIRHPHSHVASLIKQHRLFCTGESKFPRALAHMRRVGHFEFGLDRRPINVGDGVAEEVERLWQQGEEVRGTARYWASLYRWFAGQLQNDEEIANATCIIRYEDLCADPHSVSEILLRHCQLRTARDVSDFAQSIKAPSYYQPNFSEEELRIIAEETDEVAQSYGYAPSLCGEPLAL